MSRLARLLIHLFFLFLGVLFIAAALLALRLSAGPIDVSFLGGYIENAMADTGLGLSIAQTQLSWDGLGEPIELIAIDTRLSDARTGEVLADLPGMAVSLSVPDLLQGQLSPRQLRLINPELYVIRDLNGGFRLNFGGPSAPSVIGPTMGDPMVDSTTVGGSSASAAAGNEGIIDAGDSAFEGLLRALLAPPSSDTAMASLELLIIEDGEVTVDDRRLGQVWQAPGAQIEFRRELGGVRLIADLTAAVENARLTVQTDLRLRDDVNTIAIFGTVVAQGQIAQRIGRYAGTVDYRLGQDTSASSIELVGEVSVAASADDPFFAADIIVDHTFDEALTNVRFSVDNLVPADLAAFDEVLSPLRTLRSPVIASGWLRLGQGLSPEVLEIHMRAGSGTVDLPWIYDEPVTVGSVRLSATADFSASRFNVLDYRVDLGGPRIEGEGTIEVTSDGQLDVVGLASVIGMPVDLLHRYWPPGVRAARDWVLSNMSRGVIDQADVTFQARVAIDDTASTVVAVNGELRARGVTVRYLPDMRPITDTRLTARFDEAQWAIAAEGGQAGGLQLVSATVDLLGLAGDDPRADITVALGGEASSLIDVLQGEPVALGRRADLTADRVDGLASGRLRIVVPLEGDDDVSLAATVAVAALSIADVSPGRNLTGFDGTIQVDGRSVTIDGQGAVDGVPLTIESRFEYFTGPGEPVNTTRVAGRLSPREWAALDLPNPTGIDVPIGLAATITSFADETRRVVAAIDLAEAELVVAPLDYRKAPGQPASLDVELMLDAQGATQSVRLALDAPRLSAAGVLRLTPAGVASALLLERLTIGGSSMMVDATLGPNGPTDLALTGDALDLRTTVEPWLDALDDPAPADVPAAGQPTEASTGTGAVLDVAIDFNRLVLTDRLSVARAQGTVTLVDGAIAALSITGTQAGGGPLSITYRPEGTGVLIGLESGDAGALFDALDLTQSVSGGVLRLAASAGRTGIVWAGGMEMTDFIVADVPSITQFLAGQSGLAPETVRFDRAAVDFNLVGDELRIDLLRAAGGQLGLSLDGIVDIGAGRLDLGGTLVPVRSVNEFVAGIPLFGQILTAGEGFLAFTIAIDGSLDAPDVSVNPLSFLAPGIIRQIFFQAGPS